MRFGLAALALAMTACTTPMSAGPASSGGTPPGDEDIRDASNLTGVHCKTEATRPLVGRPATQALGAEALRLSGVRELRWIRPGDMVTMDYRTDRLNIHLDGQGRVQRIDCG